MSLYELFLALHILAVIAWIGSGFLLLVLANRAARAPDVEPLGRVIDATAFLGNRLFIPAALTTLAMGIGLTLEGSWGFDQLWIVLGLAGFATTFVTGTLVLKPRGDRIAELRRRDGRMTATATYEARRMLVLGRVDYLVLAMVVIDMAIKPTGDDVGVLVAMALLVAAGVAYVVARYRAIEAPMAEARPEPAPA
jgi:uncharacterized membrane protein